MKKVFLIVAMISAIAIVALIRNVYSQDTASQSTAHENIKVDVKNIDKGVQITVTADDTDFVNHIQSHASWYENMFKHGYFCPKMHDCKIHNNCNTLMNNNEQGPHGCPYQ